MAGSTSRAAQGGKPLFSPSPARYPASVYVSSPAAAATSITGGESPPYLHDTQRRCLALLVAHLTSDDDAAAPLRTALGMERAEVELLAAPLVAEIRQRDERIVELQISDSKLRWELQAKRQRVVASERTAERASDQAGSVQAEVAELRTELQRYRVRCAAAEAGLYEAEKLLLQQRQQQLDYERQVHRQMQLSSEQAARTPQTRPAISSSTPMRAGWPPRWTTASCAGSSRRYRWPRAGMYGRR